MSATHHDTEEFRGARFTHADLSGVRFRDCDLTGLPIIDSIIGNGLISGDFDRLVVNDVDVTTTCRANWTGVSPKRVLVRSLSTALDYRDTWAAIERMWAGTHKTRGGRGIGPAGHHRRQWSAPGPVRGDDARDVGQPASGLEIKGRRLGCRPGGRELASVAGFSGPVEVGEEGELEGRRGRQGGS